MSHVGNVQSKNIPFVIKPSTFRAMETNALSDTSNVVGTSIVLGVLFHLSIRRIEFELYMFHFLAAYTVTFVGFASTLVLSARHSFPYALVQASLAFASFNMGTLVSTTIYRLFYHRCRNFKGPFPAKLSRFYATYLNGRAHEYSRELVKLHEQYGDYVRTGISISSCESILVDTALGPREISILDKNAIPVIYGPNSECSKAAWYGQSGNDSRKVSINMTRDTKSYRLRRRAWDRGFSIKGSLFAALVWKWTNNMEHWHHTKPVSKPKSMRSLAKSKTIMIDPWTLPNGRTYSHSTSWAK